MLAHGAAQLRCERQRPEEPAFPSYRAGKEHLHELTESDDSLLASSAQLIAVRKMVDELNGSAQRIPR